MINKPNDWDNVKAASSSEREKLPAGGYEAKIIGAKIERSAKGTEYLSVAVDITAGEYKDFFKRDFDNNPWDNKKWRGVARFFLPVDDGTQGDNFKKRVLKAMTEALEKSNANYRWNWDETGLKGLKTGIMVRDKEYETETGAYGFSSDIFEFADIKVIKDGNFKIPKPKYLDGKAPRYPDGKASGVSEAPMPSDSDAPPELDDNGQPYPF